MNSIRNFFRLSTSTKDTTPRVPSAPTEADFDQFLKKEQQERQHSNVRMSEGVCCPIPILKQTSSFVSFPALSVEKEMSKHKRIANGLRIQTTGLDAYFRSTSSPTAPTSAHFPGFTTPVMMTSPCSYDGAGRPRFSSTAFPRRRLSI